MTASQFTNVLFSVLSLFIDALLLAMLVRAVTGWFIREETAFTNFLYFVTEPVIMPVRMLCDGLGWFQGVPIDVPFFITAVLLSLINTALRAAV